MKTEKTLYITDLDGTILDKNEHVPGKSIEILNRLMDDGLDLSYATARSIVSASKVVEGLRITIPVVTNNGVAIVHPETREVIYSTAFEKEDLYKLIKYIKKYDIYPVVYSYINGVEKCSYVQGRENPAVINYLNQPVRKEDKRVNPVSNYDELFAGRVFYIICMGAEHDFDMIYKEIVTESRYKAFLGTQLYNSDFWLEIMPIKATKSKAILKLKEMLGYDRIVCFGDGINDISMFQIADECYAVQNAADELKAIASAVIGSNEENGVAKWLEMTYGNDDIPAERICKRRI